MDANRRLKKKKKKLFQPRLLVRHAPLVRQVGDEHSRKQHRSLAELHYGKAVALFLSLKDAPCELLRTLLERVAFAEFTMAGEQNGASVVKFSQERWRVPAHSFVMCSHRSE